jgi:hypothetical protein
VCYNVAMKQWNGTCPCCGDERAYQSFLDWQCPNPACKKHTQCQEDLVEAYEEEEEVALPLRPKIAPEFTQPTKKADESDIDTIPFYPGQNNYQGSFGGLPHPADDDDDDDDTACDLPDDGTITSITTQAGDPDDDDAGATTAGNNGVSIDWDGLDGFGSGFFND